MEIPGNLVVVLKRNIDLLWMLLTVTLLAVINARWGSLIHYNNGLGTDGRIYASMALDYPGQVFDRGVWPYSPDYYFLRSLPSLVVWGFHRLLGGVPSEANVIFGFRVLNYFALIFSVWSWLRIAASLSLSRMWSWLGFLIFFTSVSSLYIPFFYPTLTDTCVIAISFWLLAAFLKNRTSELLLAIGLGSFVWPIFLPLGALLYLFPVGEGSSTHDVSNRMLRLVIAVGSGLLIAAAVIAIALSPLSGKYGIGLAGLSLTGLHAMTGISILAIFVACMVWFVTDNALLFKPIEVIQNLRWRRLALVIAYFILVKIVVRFVVGKATSSSLIALVMATTFTINHPIMFFAKHALYFGCGFILFYLFFQKILNSARMFGLGLWLFLGIHLILGFDVESRHLALAFPVFAVLGIKEASSRFGEGRRVLFCFLPFIAAYSLLWFWVPRVVQESDVYHQYIWGLPDGLSLFVFFISLLGGYSLIFYRKRSFLDKA